MSSELEIGRAATVRSPSAHAQAAINACSQLQVGENDRSLLEEDRRLNPAMVELMSAQPKGVGSELGETVSLRDGSRTRSALYKGELGSVMLESAGGRDGVCLNTIDCSLLGVAESDLGSAQHGDGLSSVMVETVCDKIVVSKESTLNDSSVNSMHKTECMVGGLVDGSFENITKPDITMTGGVETRYSHLDARSSLNKTSCFGCRYPKLAGNHDEENDNPKPNLDFRTGVIITHVLKCITELSRLTPKLKKIPRVVLRSKDLKTIFGRGLRILLICLKFTGINVSNRLHVIKWKARIMKVKHLGS